MPWWTIRYRLLSCFTRHGDFVLCDQRPDHFTPQCAGVLFATVWAENIDPKLLLGIYPPEDRLGYFIDLGADIENPNTRTRIAFDLIEHFAKPYGYNLDNIA